MAELARDEFIRGRIRTQSIEVLLNALTGLRATLGDYLGAGTDEIALTHHTTEGMNIALWGLGLNRGDRVITSTLEHLGAVVPLVQLQRRVGIELAFVDIGVGGNDETLAALASALEKPTKVVAISHIPYGTGAVLPLKEIADLCHSRGALLLVDGAQSVGAIPLDLNDLGVDFYAFPGQKWLCGPEGTGGLYVRREHLDTLQTTQSGTLGIDYHAYRANEPQSVIPAEGAAKYEVGSIYRPGLAALLAGMHWHLEHVTKDELPYRIHSLTAYARTLALELPNTRVLTPEQQHAGLISFIPAGLDPVATVEHLAVKDVMIRSIPENGAIRLSC
ncbi:MAG TPA: aminotransferase class V-fold PLP-dependent enzyme, partial [Candidatus Acidoferrum sp.]|nr:aminotransferase class V-fold PLP-dependent enzyme [Candidatus Acidoferrum sp.]